MSASQPFILYITGQSASGKTTLYKSLKRQYKSQKRVAVHDIDEDGVPKNGRGHWRLYRVDELLAYAKARLKRGNSTIICGITLPHEVIGSEYYEPGLNIHYLMLKITQKEFVERIKPRLEKWGELHLLAAWKRGNNQIAKVIYNQIVNQKYQRVIDSGKLSKSQILKEARSYIESISTLNL